MSKIRAANINPKNSNGSLPESVKSTLRRKLDTFKKKFPEKSEISIEELKKVYQNGSAKTTSKLNPIAIARVNKYLEKASSKHIKKSINKFSDGGLLAPNGKPSNLNPEQYKLVRTPEFKAWFGDWESDPENASKVVDSNGEPMVVWHTTDKEFFVFNKKKSKEGFYFSPDKKRLEVYNKSKLFSFFLNIKNPSHEIGKMYSNALIEKGYDGIMDYGYARKINEYLYEIIAVDPNQIKLADGSNTTFDANNPDIRFAAGGKVDELKGKIKIYPSGTSLIDFYKKEYFVGTITIIFDKVENLIVAPILVSGKKKKDYLKSAEYKDIIDALKKYDIKPSDKLNYIEQIDVNESDRGKGYASNMLKQTLDFYKEEGDRYLMLSVGSDNTEKSLNDAQLTDFYKRHGFELLEQRSLMIIDLTKHIIYAAGRLLAPNGKKSNLNAEQYALVRTLAFKKWFGDWENDPKNASKVVDENGEPKVMYHGSPNIDMIKVFKSTKGYDYNFFTEDILEASNYSDNTKNIKSFFLNLKRTFNPNNLSKQEKSDSKKIIKELQNWFIEHQKETEPDFDLEESKEAVSTNKNASNLQYVYDILTNEEDNWILLEHSKFQEYIKKNNYDSFITNEGGVENVAVYNSNNIKLADGSNTTFDANNPDIRYESGGEMIRRADGHYSKRGLWDNIRENIGSGKKPTKEMLEQERKIKSMEYGASLEPDDFKNELTVSDIDNKYPEVSHEYINQQLMKGIQVEMEHTDNPEVARKIALDHLNENIQYYEYLDKMESEMASQAEIDQHFEEIYKKGGETSTNRIPSTDRSVWNAKYKVFDKVKIRIDMMDKSGSPTDIYTIESVILDGMPKRPENPSGMMYKLNLGGGTWEGKDLEYADESKNVVKPDLGFDPIFSFKTPTGEKTRLNYIQQVLVRTSKFKAFFGDWEMAARSFIADGRNNFDRHFEDVSKIVDSVTLEPRVVFHGTMSEKEFYNFDVTREKGIGRPYAYFAFNKEYSQNFTIGSQRGDNDGKAILYHVFLNVRHPFYALGPQFEDVKEDAEHWVEVITDRIYYDKYKKTQKDEFHSALKSTIYGQVGRYVTKAFPNDIKEKFWRLMSYDADKEFKYFLIAYGYDGVIYDEEFTSQYNIDDSSSYTKAVTVFDARQIKLADGRNTEFNPMLSDIRFEEGGKVNEGHSSEHITENHNTMNKKEQLEKMMFGGSTGIFKDGGKVKGDGNLHHDAKDGGFFVGHSHADGGIKAINKDTGQIIEVEGNEVIINKRSVSDTTKREFEGEMLTNREILSRINEAGGGVKFEDGGPLSCCGKKYKFGGETKEDFTIVYEISQTKDGHTVAHEYLKEVYK